MKPRLIVALSVITVSSGCAQVPVTITASGSVKDAVLARLDANTKRHFARGVPFVLTAKAGAIEDTVWPDGRPLFATDVQWSSVLTDQGGGPRVLAKRLRTTIRMWDREGRYVPDVGVEIDALDGGGRELQGAGRSEGATIAGGFTWASTSGLAASLDFAFYDAYLNALAAIADEQVSSH